MPDDDVIRAALKIVDDVERQSWLKDTLLGALEEAVHNETRLDGIIDEFDDIVFLSA